MTVFTVFVVDDDGGMLHLVSMLRGRIHLDKNATLRDSGGGYLHFGQDQPYPGDAPPFPCR
jgi:hypothetical protein